MSSATFMTGYEDFLRGVPLAPSMNEKDITHRFHRQGFCVCAQRDLRFLYASDECVCVYQ